MVINKEVIFCISPTAQAAVSQLISTYTYSYSDKVLHTDEFTELRNKFYVQPNSGAQYILSV